MHIFPINGDKENAVISRHFSTFTVNLVQAKSSKNKVFYMDEITGNRGVIFATGTPVSNSMTELYTMQRYLQYERLQELNMTHFDCWASRFGETVTALELAPEGYTLIGR